MILNSNRSVKKELLAHTNDTINPHNVTAQQIGAVISKVNYPNDMTDVLAWCEKCDTGCQFAVDGISVANVPISGLYYTGELIIAAGEFRTVRLKASHYGTYENIYVNTGTEWAWTGWEKVATTDYAVNKAGDTITGELLLVNSEGYGSRIINTLLNRWSARVLDKHGNVYINNVIGSDESYPFSQIVIGPKDNPFIQFGYGSNNAYEKVFEIIHSGNFFNYALPRDGSAAATHLSATLDNIGYASMTGVALEAVFEAFQSDLARMRKLSLRNLECTENDGDALHLINTSTNADHTILHTDNKPSGSYTGNGDVTKRIIEIGGISQAIIVFSDIGFVIIRNGGIGKYAANGELIGFTYYQTYFIDGSLVIESDHDLLNANGINYWYNVL